MYCKLYFDPSHDASDCSSTESTRLPANPPPSLDHSQQQRSQRQPRRTRPSHPSTLLSSQTRTAMEEGGFTIVECSKNQKSHQSSYWRPKRRGHQSCSSSMEKDIEMIDSHSEATLAYPPLSLESRSPTLLPPQSPQIHDSI